MAYETVVTGARGQDPVRDKVYIDVDSGAILGVHPQIYFAENRKVYSANNGTDESRPFARLIPAYSLTQVRGDYRTHNPQDGCQNEAARFVFTRDYKLGDNPSNETNHDRPYDAHQALLSRRTNLNTRLV
jgi:hypothetical protein